MMAADMSIKRSLSILIGMFLAALVVVATVGVGVAWLVRAQTSHLAKETSPLQVGMARLQQDIERVAKLFTLISVSADGAGLAALRDEASRTLADARATVVELDRLHAGVDAQALTQLDQAFATVAAMGEERLSANAVIVAAHRQIQERTDAVLAINAQLIEAMAGLRGEAQKTLEDSQSSSFKANRNIKTLMELQTRTAEIRTLIIQVATVESKYRLASYKDRMRAPLDGLRAGASDENGLDAVIDEFSNQTPDPTNPPATSPAPAAEPKPQRKTRKTTRAAKGPGKIKARTRRR